MSQGADSIVTFLDTCKRIYKRNFSYDVQIFIITHSHPSDFNRGNTYARGPSHQVCTNRSPTCSLLDSHRVIRRKLRFKHNLPQSCEVDGGPIRYHNILVSSDPHGHAIQLVAI